MLSDKQTQLANIELSNKALDIFEQLEAIVNNLEGFSRELPAAKSKELEVYIERIKALIVVLDENTALPGVCSALTNVSTSLRKLTKVERLGISADILRLFYKEGKSVQEISEIFGDSVHPATIRRFLSIYENYSNKEKIKAQTNGESVFNTQNQLERLLTMINTQLGRLAYSNDPKVQENHKGYLSELRQVIKLASDFQKEIFNMLQTKQFQEDVRHILVNLMTGAQREEAIQILDKYRQTGFAPSSVEVHNAAPTTIYLEQVAE